MIEELLPAGAVAVECRAGEAAGDAVLEAVERPVVERAREPRRREFATGRDCARRALERLGVPAAPIAKGESGEPLWPSGIVGSITHCTGYVAAAVARAGEVSSIGIDAEPDAPLPEGVLERITSAGERARLAAGTELVAFSAKEAIYKAWFPLARRWLGFEDVDLTVAADGTFAARVLVPGPVARFDGRWRRVDGLVLTAVAVIPPDRG